MEQQQQTDPWVEAAKNFKPQASSGSVPAGNQDWKLWQSGAAAPTDTRNAIQKGFDRFTTVTPEDEQGVGPVGRFAGRVGAGIVEGIGAPFMHPIQTIKGIGETISRGQGTPWGVAGEMARPAVEDFVQNGAEKALPHQLGNLMGGAALGEAAGPLVGRTAEAAGNGLRNLRPMPSADIVPPVEMASRKLSQAILPATKDASNFIQAAPHEVPNVLDYAKRTGNNLRTQLEFSKAAEGSAQEARDFYENQILKPNDRTVKTTGTGFGERKGESPDTYATLSDIDKRVVEINKQLDKPALNSDDARRALASKQDLQAEASKLRDILHQNLAQATGLRPDDIVNLRQRVGRGYELANDTNAAVTSRMQSEGRAEQGPLHLSQMPSKLLDMVRGGPTAIADRQFQRAIRNFPGQAQPLPTLNPPVAAEAVPQRAPLWNGIQSVGQPALQTIVPDIEGAMQSPGVKARTQRFMDLSAAQNAARDAEAQEAARVQNLREQGKVRKTALKQARDNQ